MNQSRKNCALAINNNVAENAPPRALRDRMKNWLFSASANGAKTSANLYSMIETAKANGHGSYHYLCHEFKELPWAITIEQIEALLPWVVKSGETIAKD